ncbi:hypothetical protein [Brucella pituitosa]|uniref:hypothetical protein n=1 Tax=Brucella pituitosa TaxID=571256 RepID=UPI003F4A87E7
MNKRSEREQEERRKVSPRALRYFPRFALFIVAVLLLFFLGWSLTGGVSLTQKPGIQAPPARGSADHLKTKPPVENDRPQTGMGGDHPANPPADQK